MLAARTRGRIAPTLLNVADDIPVSNLSKEKLGPAFRWRDGLFVQEFDSEITLWRKALKAQAKFYGWVLGTQFATGSSLRRDNEPSQLIEPTDRFRL
jgi:hypothetical protein